MLKRLKFVVFILCITLLFTGCHNFRFASSIEDLISPVSPSGENADVRSAVDEFCKSGYSIKIPAGGKYKTSFIFYDLDDDKEDEAVSFFEPNNELGSVNMAILKKTNEKWSVVDNIVGKGTGVNQVDFGDVNNDGSVEIIVGWSAISKSKVYDISVYRQNFKEDKYSLENIADSIRADDFICIDIDDDNKNELLTFKLGGTNYSPKATLYSFNSNREKELGDTSLDNSIISFDNIVSCKTDQGTSVFVDCSTANSNTMVTEFIYWSNYYDSIISPFFDYSTYKTKDTTRNNAIFSRDIDNDKMIEIPLSKSVKGLHKELKAQNWVCYKSTVLNHKYYSISCKRDDYILLLTDDQFSRIKFTYNDEERELAALAGKKGNQCFSIRTVIKSDYDSDRRSYEEYEKIFENSGYVYLARVDEEAGLNVSVEDLTNMIKPY